MIYDIGWGFSTDCRDSLGTILKFYNNAIAERYKGIGWRKLFKKTQSQKFCLFCLVLFLTMYLHRRTEIRMDTKAVWGSSVNISKLK